VLDKAEYSAFESTLNSPIVSYRIVFNAAGRAKNSWASVWSLHFSFAWEFFRNICLLPTDPEGHRTHTSK